MPDPTAVFLKDLKKIQSQLLRETSTLYKKILKMPSDANALEIVRNIDFMKEMNRLGLGVALDKYKDAYSQIMRDYAGVVKQSGLVPSGIKANIRELETLRNFDFNSIVAKHKYFAEDLQTTVMRNILVKTPHKNLAEQFANLTAGDLTSSQAKMGYYESIKRFDRTVTFKMYEDAPVELRYVYWGPNDARVDPNTCRVVLDDERNISGYGFTKAEINNLPVDMINGGHFGCRHIFVLATKGAEVPKKE